MMEPIVYSVSDLVAIINQTLEFAYPVVFVEGEISSFKINRQKYVFFDLKDEETLLNCFMSVYQMRNALEDGMRVRVKARPRLTSWGKFSLTILDIQPVGKGSIKRSFDLLRQKLEREGLFDKERKRTLPLPPNSIGVIASVESAGYSDFLKILNNRWPMLTVQVADVQVQGFGASEQIIRAINFFNQSQEIEVLVIVRGGGSQEDLAVFNEEPLVRVIAGSRLPILVGVGHERDVTLSDLAADVRAATPSNAAELLVPDRTEVLSRLQNNLLTVLHRVHQQLRYKQEKVEEGRAALNFRLEQVIDAKRQRLQYNQQILAQLDPSVILKRGYAIVRDETGRILTDKKVSPHSTIVVELEKTIIKAGVIDAHIK